MISVITVTKNNLAGLRATGKSLTAQTHRNFEWIIIDGGNDESKDFILPSSRHPERSEGSPKDEGHPSTTGFQPSAQDGRLIYIREPDHGIYDAMNKGLGRSTGSHLLFLNAGDTLAAPETLAIITAQTADFIYGDALESRHVKKARSHNAAALGMFTHHQAMIYSRDAIGDLRYDTTYKIAADYDFILRILQHAESISYIPQALCVFEPGGISQTNAKLGRREQFQIRRKLGLSNPLENAFIYVTQFLVWHFRKLLPNLYWAFKKNC